MGTISSPRDFSTFEYTTDMASADQSRSTRGTTKVAVFHPRAVRHTVPSAILSALSHSITTSVVGLALEAKPISVL